MEKIFTSVAMFAVALMVDLAKRERDTTDNRAPPGFSGPKPDREKKK